MKLLSTLSAAACAALLLGTPASAATIQLDATALHATASDFSIVYDDVDGDDMLSLDEVISFSGISFTWGSAPSFDTLIAVPIIAAIADGTTFEWHFGQSTGGSFATVHAANFTYVESPFDMPAVPLPASLPLMLFGLAAFFGLRRKQA